MNLFLCNIIAIPRHIIKNAIMTRWTLIYIVLLFLLGCAQSENQLEDYNWPMFRRDRQHTGVNNIKAVQQEQICELKWKFQTMDGVLSSPAIVDGMVYFGSKDGHLYAVEIKTGRLHWKFKTERGSWVVSSPTAADGIVFFQSNDRDLYAADTRTGKEKWKFKTRDKAYSSPAIHNGVVYIGTIYALDFKTGKEKWQFQAGRKIFSSPAIDSGIVYFGGEDDYLYALDIETGEQKWKFETKGDVQSSPAVYGGVVYFGSNDGNLYAVDTKTGNEKWKFKTGDWVFSSPAVADGMVYFGSKDQHLYAVDIKTGKEKWRFKTDGEVLSSPAISVGTVFFGSRDGNLYAVEMKIGREKWRFKTGGEIVSSPAVVDSVVYFGSEDGNLYAVRFFKQKKQVRVEKLFPIKQYGKWGYINKKGDIVIKPQFDEASTFSEGLACVRIGGRSGYINQRGNYVINSIFDEVKDFHEGLVAVRMKDGWGYIDQTGQYVIKPKYYDVGPFSEGLAAAKIDSKYGYINNKGKMVVQPQFDKADGFSEGIAYVEIENMACYINRKGKFVWRSNIDSNEDIISVLKKYFNSIEKMYQYENESVWQSLTSTIHKQSSLLNKRIPGLGISLDEDFEHSITFDLKELRVIKRDNREAKIKCLHIIKQIKGPAFRNRRVTAIYTMKSSYGDWKIFNIEVSNIDYLDKNKFVEIPIIREDFITNQDTGKYIIWASTRDVSWVRLFGGQKADYVDSIQQTSDDGYIIAGESWSLGGDRPDIFLIKTDTQGKRQWLRTFGGWNYEFATSLQQTSDGGYIVAGGIISNSRDTWLIKTNTEGLKQWEQIFRGPIAGGAEAVYQTSDGGYILAGIKYNRSYGNSVWLIKTNAQGIKLWDHNYGNIHSFGRPQSVQQTLDGGYILAVSREIDRATRSNMVLIKIDRNGNKQWERTFGGPSYDDANFVRQTREGGYILGGNTYSYGAGRLDAWLIKTDSNGNKQWDTTFGGAYNDHVFCVQQTSDGGYIMAGWTQSFGAGEGDMWLIKTDNEGRKEWENTFGESGTDITTFAQQTSDGGYILVGYTDSYSDDNRDLLLIKIKPKKNNGKRKIQFSDDFSSDIGWINETSSPGGS